MNSSPSFSATMPLGNRATDSQEPARWLLPVFFIVVLMPLSVSVAGLRLTPLRVMLLLLFFPFLIRILRGDAGRITGTDTLMIFHAIWIVIALMVVHGVEKLPFAGITMVELVGGYLLGRVLIRNSADYRRMIRMLFYSMLFLLPFSVIELLTGRLVIPELVGNFFDTVYRGGSAYGRLGLERVYAVFEHPILFGMFCSLAIANLFYMARGMSFGKYIGMAVAMVMTFMSLSSAPLLACGLQLIMIIWDKITKGAWTTFVVLGIVGYVTVDLLSNRTPITIFIDSLTFNSATGWTRIAIFEYGLQNAIANPVFGIGFNDWERPSWLTSSVDNFWLLTSMRYGFVGAGFLVTAFAIHFVSVILTPVREEDARRLRTAYCITLIASVFTMITVHIWGAVGVFVMFFLGAGSWFYTNPTIRLDPEQNPERVAPAGLPARSEKVRRGARYSRFEPNNRRLSRK